MAYIRKISDGKYQVCWREPVLDSYGVPTDQLKQRTETISGKAAEKAAQRRARDIEDELECGSNPTAQRDRALAPLGEYARDYFDALVGPKPSQRTIDGYREQYLTHIAPVFGGRPVGSIRIADIKRFRAQLLTTPTQSTNKPRSPKTVGKILGVLRQILQTAVENEAISTNPAKEVPIAQSSTFVPERLTPEQIAAVADWITQEKHNPLYALAVTFAAFTGLRAAELAGLEIKDVTLSDDNEGSISVTKTKTKVDGQWITGPTKSRKVRTVPLDAWLARRIKTYLTDVHPYGNPKSFAYQPNAPLFPGRLNLAHAKEQQRNVKDRASLFNWAEPIDCSNAYKRYLQPATEALGLPDVRWHDLRHTFAVMSLAGDHYRDVSRWLGHEKISTTLDFYASVIPTEQGGKKAPLPEPVAPVRETAADNVIELRPHGTE